MRMLRRIGLAFMALVMVLGMCVPAMVEAAPDPANLSFRTENADGALLLSGSDVTCVGLAGAPDDAPAVGPNVRLVFDGSHRQRLSEVTTAHVGEKIAIVLNGKVLMAPVLRDPITGGEVVVYGEQGWDARALRDTIHRDAGVPLCPA